MISAFARQSASCCHDHLDFYLVSWDEEWWAVGLFTTEASACLTMWEKLPYAEDGEGAPEIFEIQVQKSLDVFILGLWPRWLPETGFC